MVNDEDFQIINTLSKPKMRWWLPGAFLEEDELEKEIKDLVGAGYGGAEILYFIGIPTKEVDPKHYGDYYFGSKRWNKLMIHALETAIKLDFKVIG